MKQHGRKNHNISVKIFHLSQIFFGNNELLYRLLPKHCAPSSSCGGGLLALKALIRSCVWVFIPLHRSGFNFDFVTFFNQFDNWLLLYGRKNAKISGCFKRALPWSSRPIHFRSFAIAGTSVLQQCQKWCKVSKKGLQHCI